MLPGGAPRTKKKGKRTTEARRNEKELESDRWLEQSLAVEELVSNSTVLIHVEDRGRGIDPEIRDHAFEPFTSTKHTVGVGMGLTVARHSMRNLGGEVTLMPRNGGGATATPARDPLGRVVDLGIDITKDLTKVLLKDNKGTTVPDPPPPPEPEPPTPTDQDLLESRGVKRDDSDDKNIVVD